ncbi:LysR family transcriptional regulator [Inquilinus sp. OTU3971]|uniref:LysR family transcriptional regulator n=1 Tax=Inquilinus sp. OTU3971 TaxID=3043855 RepID=UPI00313B16EC
MHPRLLRTFLAVARHRSVTRAAEEVHLAQSSVSDQIQSLEAELGTSLFTRAKPGLELTPAGEVLRSYAEDILALADEARAAVQAAAGRMAGMLTIGALETIAAATLPQWLSGFRDGHPDIDLRMRVAGSGELLRMLEDGRIDITFCFDRGSLDERFARRIVAMEPLVLVAPPGSPPGAVSADLAGLAVIGFVATEPGCVYRHMLDTAFVEAGIAAPKPAAEVGSIQAIARLVAAGTGVALVPRLAVGDALDRGEIAELPWPGSVRSAALAAIWRRRRVQPPALKLLLAALDDGFAPIRSAGGRPRHAAPSPS